MARAGGSGGHHRIDAQQPGMFRDGGDGGSGWSGRGSGAHSGSCSGSLCSGILPCSGATGEKHSCGLRCSAADRKCAILEPVRNWSVVCFERVTTNSECEAEPVRNDVSWRKFVSEMTGRESPSLIRNELELTIFVGFSTVQSSRLERVAFLCLQ